MCEYGALRGKPSPLVCPQYLRRLSLPKSSWLNHACIRTPCRVLERSERLRSCPWWGNICNADMQTRLWDKRGRVACLYTSPARFLWSISRDNANKLDYGANRVRVLAATVVRHVLTVQFSRCREKTTHCHSFTGARASSARTMSICASWIYFVSLRGNRL